MPMQQHAVARVQLGRLQRQRERHRRRARCCRGRGSVSGTRSGSMPSGAHMAAVCTMRDLVDDVAVHARPVELRRGSSQVVARTARSPASSRPRVSVRMPSRSPTHSSWCCGGGAGDAADEAVAVGVAVGAAEHHRRRAGPEGERGEVVVDVVRRWRPAPASRVEGGLLRSGGCPRRRRPARSRSGRRRSSSRRAACR